LTTFNVETADSSRPAQRPRPRIESLTDLVFGLALSIGAIILISKPPANPDDLFRAIAGFGFSFLILIQIWFRFTEIMSVLPVQTNGTRVLNTLILFLVALEPYLFNILPFFFTPPQYSSPLYDVTSSVHALDIGAIYGILALFTNILGTEERKLVSPDLLRKYRLSRNLEIVVASIFLISSIPQLFTLSLRYAIWASTFFVYRGGSIVKRISESRRHQPS
jgi:uncharacterized membrane protein